MPINKNGKLRVKGVTTGGNGGGVNLTEFISVWDTTLGDGNPSISLPLVASGNYNFSVNWGDGNTDTITAYDQAEILHNYSTGGVYTITITGTIEGWSFAKMGGDCPKITSITNIGPLKLGNEGAYFYGCSNLTTIGGIFDLTGTTIFNNMFNSCTSLTSVNGIGSWNTSAVISMKNVFNGATNFNQNIGGWDVSAVSSMGGMFAAATSFNQPLNSWNVSSVIDMGYMFQNATSFNADINGWDVSSVTSMYGMFQEATSFNGNIGGWDVSSVTDMGNFMYGKTSADFNPLTYDNILNSWSLINLQPNVTWGMGSIEYTSAGATARQDIIDNYSWTITDGGEI